MMNVIMRSVIILSVIMLNFVILSVIMLNAIILNVTAPQTLPMQSLLRNFTVVGVRPYHGLARAGSALVPVVL